MNVWSFQFWAGPLLGAVIGLITNGIAIRMLFRPLHPVYFAGYQLPFTPGLIPKEQARIAASVGKVCSEELFNAEIISKGLINPEIDEKIHKGITGFARKMKKSDETIRQAVYKACGQQKTEQGAEWVEKNLTKLVYAKALEMDIGTVSVGAIMSEIESHADDNPSLSRFVTGSILEMMGQKISLMINEAIEKQGFEIIYDAIVKEGDDLLDLKFSDIYKAGSEYLPKIDSWMIETYHSFVRNNLGKIIYEINMASLVEEQINSYSPADMEKLLMELVKKELNAIVYLGGLLGMIMGFIMNFI